MRIGLTILGGYLGSGKTTLLNGVLAKPGAERLGLIVNDFGAINVDAELIQARDNQSIMLANGCVCCSISDGFAEALASLARRDPRPERVIVEASGVADPGKTALFGSLPPYRLDGIVVTADVETICDRAGDRYVGETVVRQLRNADIVVLNKTDLVGAARCDEVARWISERAPEARIVKASYGNVPLSVLAGIGREKPVDNAGGSDPAFASWSAAYEHPLDEQTFRVAVARWPAGVLRAKGLVTFAGDERRYVFQLAGKRWSLETIEGEPTASSQVVAIGLAGTIDGDRLLQALAGR